MARDETEERGGPLRVMVVDDHPVVRHGLVALLRAEPDLSVVAEADGVARAAQLFDEHRPDATLLDVRLADGDGIELVKKIRTGVPDARFVVLTTFDDDEAIERAFSAGVISFLPKSAPPEAIVRALRLAHRGERDIPPEIARKLAHRLYHPLFTPKELDVLTLLAWGSIGSSNKELAARLGVSPGTVKTHLASIFRKLGAHDRTQAVSLAVTRGLIRLR